MRAVASGANLGVFIEPLRASQRYTLQMAGNYRRPDGKVGPWMFGNLPIPDGGTEPTNPASKALAQGTFIAAAYDETRRLDKIAAEWLKNADLGVRIGTNPASLNHHARMIFSLTREWKQ